MRRSFWLILGVAAALGAGLAEHKTSVLSTPYTAVGEVHYEAGLVAPAVPKKIRDAFSAELTRYFLFSGWDGGFLKVETDGHASSGVGEQLDRTATQALVEGQLPGAEYSTSILVRRDGQVLNWRHGLEHVYAVSEMTPDDSRYDTFLSVLEPVVLLEGRVWLEPEATLEELVAGSSLVESSTGLEERSGRAARYSRYTGDSGVIEVWTAETDAASQPTLIRLRMSKGPSDFYRGRPVSEEDSLRRYLPESKCSGIVYDVGATQWAQAGDREIPVEGYSRTEYCYDAGETIMWNAGRFEIASVEATGSADLAASLIGGIRNGAEVRRLSQDTGGVVHEWRDGEIVVATSSAATARLESAIDGAAGLGESRMTPWIWLAAGGLVVLLAAGLVVVLRRRGQSTAP